MNRQPYTVKKELVEANCDRTFAVQAQGQATLRINGQHAGFYDVIAQ